MATKKKAPVRKPVAAQDEWSPLGSSGAIRARLVAEHLVDLQRLDHAAQADIEKARGFLGANKPLHAKDRVNAVYVNLGQAISDAWARYARVDAIRREPLLVDESSAQTRAHRLADAFDQEVRRLGEIRIAASRALIGDAQQVSVALAEVEKFWIAPNPCGCLPPKSQSIVALGADRVAEPVLAIAESGAVYGCGACPEEALSGDRTTPPAIIQIERAIAAADGATQLVHEATVPIDVAKDWIDGKVCLPWVRVERDPRHFRECMAASAALGPVKNAKDVFRMLKTFFAKQDQEVFVVVMCDVQLQVRAMSEIVRGARDHAEVPIPDVLRLPLIQGAQFVFVAHNHPSGKVEPSEGDKKFTKELERAFAQVGIRLVDHVVVGHSKYFSFADHGLI